MAAQKMLKKQASEEEHELASGATAVASASSFHPLPQLAASGDAEPAGPEGRAATYVLERPPRGPSPGPSAFQPVLGGRGHMGPSERAAVAVPSLVGPQLGVEAAGRGGRLELRSPMRPVPSPPFADFGKIPRPHAALSPGSVPFRAAASVQATLAS